MERRSRLSKETNGVAVCHEALDRDEMARALRDAGCTEKEAAALLACGGEPRRLLELLARHRAALLDEVHKSEKKIDCLDYLVYQIKHNKQREE